MAFARAQSFGLVGLAVLLRGYRFVAVESAPIEPTVVLSLRPSREVLLRVEPRD